MVTIYLPYPPVLCLRPSEDIPMSIMDATEWPAWKLIVAACAVLLAIVFIANQFPHQVHIVTLGPAFRDQRFSKGLRVIVAKDEEALDRSRSGDSETILRLTAAGRIDSTPGGIKARVVWVHELQGGDQN